MKIWLIDYDGSKSKTIKNRELILGRISIEDSEGSMDDDPDPEFIENIMECVVVLHTLKIDEWKKYLEGRNGVYALFVSKETGGRISSGRNDSLKNAYFSVKYGFGALIGHPLFKDLIKATQTAEDTNDPNFQSAWKALKDDLVSLEPLVIANAMLSAGQALGELPQELREAAEQAYEAKKREGDPAWDAFIKQDAEKRNRWLEEVI